MATKKKMLQAAAGQAGGAGGAGLDITDVFSTYLYTGNGSTQTITNGIDLAGEGGLVWTKNRNQPRSHNLVDTERGVGLRIKSNATEAEYNEVNGVTSFNSDGYSLSTASDYNANNDTYASWTFRKAPKFFDVVTYTGTGSAQTISHNLGAVPGAIIIKRTSATSAWPVWHRSIYALSTSGRLLLNETTEYQNSSSTFNSTEPTDSVFTVGTSNDTNASGSTYVAYLFAHNDGDGVFGPNEDQDIIKCGSYTHAYAGAEVNLGFEPQWILFKAANQSTNWFIFDAMRGIVTGGLSGDGDAALFPNTSDAENVNAWGVDLTPTGFIAYGNNIASSGDIIYIAIRRGTKVPESGTEVFAVDNRTGASGNLGAYRSGFPVDMAFHKVVTSALNPYETGSRLTQGKSVNLNDTSAESTASDQQYDYMDGWSTETSSNTTKYSWMWKRAPNFFDVVAYTGDSTAGRAVSHNLGVAPELYIIKVRASTVGNTGWFTYHHEGFSGNWGFRRLDAADSLLNATSFPTYFPQAPTEDNFYVGTQADVNYSGNTFIAYLFASLAGVSKVGSYTGNGTSQTIDCGFTSGARFILVKRADSTGDWYVWDTERGIVTGNDPHLSLNTTAAEVTSDDSIDPDSSGFIVNQVAATNINVSSASYIFYAIS